MYAKGMSARQILDQIQDIYGFDVNESLVTGITNKIMPEIEAWQKRPLSAVYPIVFIDAIVFNVRDNGMIKKQAAYIIPGISEEGHKRSADHSKTSTSGLHIAIAFILTSRSCLPISGIDISTICAPFAHKIFLIAIIFFSLGKSTLYRTVC